MKIKNSFFPQKGIYKWYLLKYFGTFTIFIDRAVIEFEKHWLINHSNTKENQDKFRVGILDEYRIEFLYLVNKRKEIKKI